MKVIDDVRIVKNPNDVFGGGDWRITGDVRGKNIAEQAKNFPAAWRNQASSLSVYENPEPGFRAFYRNSEGRIHIAERESKSVVLHEMAHHMEYEINGLSRASKAFLRRRYAGKVPKKLGGTYEDHEIGVSDKFNDKYIGKWYSSKATEVVTMGWEGLIHGKWSFWTGDAEWRHLILGMAAAL
jgi:hypothetical protein